MSLDGEIILNDSDNIPLKIICHPLIYNNLLFNPFYYNKILVQNEDGKIKFYPFDSITPIKYYLICGYNQNTNFIEGHRVDIDDKWVDILNGHMRLNGDI
jgi:hypothetical protein